MLKYLMPSAFRDYYEVLEVPRTASESDIKQAYRRLARKHHPDLNPEKEKDIHTKRMQEINEAYAVLGAKENREKYDQYGEHWKDGPPPPPPSSDSRGGEGRFSQEQFFSQEQAGGFSDFFRNMFQQGERSAESEGPMSAELDIEAELDLSLEEAVHGVEKSFSLMTAGLCPNCHGSGRIKNKFCPVCGGVGEIRRPREVKAKIPAGLTEGSRIRLKGQGNEGQGLRGDLYLRIHLQADPRFRIDGKNLETDVRIMPWQAALGSEAAIQTLDGPIKVRISKGTHSGKRLRLAGKGLGKPASRGDLFIRIDIDIPDTISPEMDALFKKMEEESHG